MNTIVRKIVAPLVLFVLAFVLLLGFTAPAGATVVGARWRAWQYALSQRWDSYCWGGTGPGCWDCSGLVYKAYRKQGFAIPRTTNDMLSWWRLHRERHWQARKGDLVFYGSGHVELYSKWRQTFGALESSYPVNYHHWYWSSWWQPSGYYHIRGAH